jgi:hypothetical protein
MAFKKSRDKRRTTLTIIIFSELILSEHCDHLSLMQLPFTSEEFFSVFARYNNAVWPMQWVLGIMAVVAISLALRKRAAGRSIAVVLAIFWLWMGIRYHWAFFAAINPAAKFFGALFVIQGLLFLMMGAWRNMLNFERPTGARRIIGWILIFYAIVIYPLLGNAVGHHYPTAPTFGLPCPTTIFTLGLLLWAAPNARWWLMIIPWLWAAIGTMAAIKLGVIQDYGLAVAGITSILVTFTSGKVRKTSVPEGGLLSAKT